MVGGTGAVTVRFAAGLVTFPYVLVTFTVKSAPLSPRTVVGVVYEMEVAPEMEPPFLNHW